MKLAEVFPTCAVQVFREMPKRFADLYLVVGSEQRTLAVEASPSELRYPPPRVGDLVYLEAVLPGAIHRMQTRVLDVAFGAAIRLTVTPHGVAERILRRKECSARVRIPVRIAPLRRSDGPPMALRTRKLSLLGLRTCSPQSLDAGTWLNIALRPDDDSGPIVCRGRVLHCWPRDDGRFDLRIRFHNITPEQKVRLVGLLRTAATPQRTEAARVPFANAL